MKQFRLGNYKEKHCICSHLCGYYLLASYRNYKNTYTVKSWTTGYPSSVNYF